MVVPGLVGVSNREGGASSSAARPEEEETQVDTLKLWLKKPEQQKRPGT